MLVTCPDCGRRISDAARACPGCGRPSARSSAPTTANPRALGMLDMLNTVGRVSVMASKLIADRLDERRSASDADISKEVQRDLLGTITTDTTEGRDLTRVCARPKHVRAAKSWPRGARAFAEHRRTEWLGMIEAVERGADVDQVHAAFKEWLASLADA